MWVAGHIVTCSVVQMECCDHKLHVAVWIAWMSGAQAFCL